jgi:hypothetical protein
VAGVSRIRSTVIIRKRRLYIAHAWDRLGYSLERRRACRYTTTNHPALLGWWEGAEFRTITAALENISLEGALTHVDEAPPATGSVWVCLDGLPPSAWVEAQVVEILPQPARGSRIRLRFQESCPTGFFISILRRMKRDEDMPQPPPSRARTRTES